MDESTPKRYSKPIKNSVIYTFNDGTEISAHRLMSLNNVKKMNHGKMIVGRKESDKIIPPEHFEIATNTVCKHCKPTIARPVVSISFKMPIKPT